MRPLACLLAAVLAAAPLHAQSEPDRPVLPAGADDNDWVALYDAGVRALPTAPDEAAAAFYWASRLDPSRAEPFFGRWAAYFGGHVDVYQRYMEGDRATYRRPEVIQADSMRWRAMLRNPFVHRGLEVLVWDKIPGFWTPTRQNQGWVAYNEGRLDKAIRDFSRLIDADARRNAGYLHWRALSYVSAAKYDSALVDMQRLLAHLRQEEQRRLVGAHETKEMVEYGVGILHEARGSAAEARTALQNALVENAVFYPARVALGRIALQERRVAEAVAEYAQAVELAPDEGYLRLQYGLALGSAGRHADALAELRRARELEPHYAEIYLHLAVALERNGQKDEALEAYRGYLERAPRSSTEQIARVRGRIAALQGGAATP